MKKIRKIRILGLCEKALRYWPLPRFPLDPSYWSDFYPAQTPEFGISR